MKATMIIAGSFMVLFSRPAAAQKTGFCKTGTIEYVKTVNMYDFVQRRMDKDNESYMQGAIDNYKAGHGQFRKEQSTLAFTLDKTLYLPAEGADTSGSFFDKDAAIGQPNTVFTDIRSGISIKQKALFDQTLLLKDSLRKINWKITDETRDIAGFACRRANALILDSVYVVAFYTNRIPVSGGPESFSGLPGMILGVVLPHLHVTWFADSVIQQQVAPDAIQPPTQGRILNSGDFMELMKTAIKGPDPYRQFAIISYLL
jgi:GLPGLI family protein